MRSLLRFSWRCQGGPKKLLSASFFFESQQLRVPGRRTDGGRSSPRGLTGVLEESLNLRGGGERSGGRIPTR